MGNRGQVLLEEYHKGPGARMVGMESAVCKLKQLKNGGWMPANVIIVPGTYMNKNFLQRWLGRYGKMSVSADALMPPEAGASKRLSAKFAELARELLGVAAWEGYLNDRKDGGCTHDQGYCR